MAPSTDKAEQTGKSTPDIDSAGVYFMSVDDFEWRPDEQADGTPAPAPPAATNEEIQPSRS